MSAAFIKTMRANDHPVLAQVEELSQQIDPCLSQVLIRWEHEIAQLRKDRETLIRTLALTAAVLHELGHAGLAEIPLEGCAAVDGLPLEKEGMSAAETGRELGAILGRVELQRRSRG